MKSEVQLWIPGKPRTKGSYVAIQPKGGGRAFLKNADKHLAEWTNLIRIAWNNRESNVQRKLPDEILAQHEWPYPSEDCFEVTVLCELERPKSHFGSGKNAKILKKSAPAVLHCPRRPDGEKVLRAIMDALTAYAWKDDKQVVMCKCRKVWSTLDMTSICISQLNDGDEAVDLMPRKEELDHGTQVLPQRGQQRHPPA